MKRGFSVVAATVVVAATCWVALGTGAAKPPAHAELLGVQTANISTWNQVLTALTKQYAALAPGSSFNSAYILDFLKALGSKGEVRIAFKDGTSSALFRPEGGEQEAELKYTIMPMRV